MEVARAEEVRRRRPLREPTPLLSRQAYRWEIVSSLYMPVARACLEAGLLGVIADRAFHAPAFVTATITAAPALANITSAFWIRMIHGVDRVRAVSWLQGLTLASIALIALAPFNRVGLVMLVVGVLVGRAATAGILTARADVWMTNYPRKQRGRLTGMLTILSLIGMNITAINVGSAMDAHGPRAYRVVFGVTLAFGAVGMWAWSQVRWRGRAEQLARERKSRLLERSGAGFRAMWMVIRSDHHYRKYMTAQFLLGLPSIAATAPLIIGLNRGFELGYGQSVALTQVIPAAVPIVVIPLWARLLDRAHIITFRSVHAWFFVVAHTVTGIGFLSGSLWMMYVAQVVLGAAFAGGMLAWNLGHHDFASKELASVYMGIHVTLTGVRGAIGPFLGVLMFSGVSAALPGVGRVEFALGGWTFIVFAAVTAFAGMMFMSMRSAMTEEELRASDLR